MGLFRLLPRRVRRQIHKDYMASRGCTYCADGLVTFHSSAFLDDPLFQEA
jgi:hypothetical protein